MNPGKGSVKYINFQLHLLNWVKASSLSFFTIWMFYSLSGVIYSENTAEGRRITKLDQILLNGNNITMVSLANLIWARSSHTAAVAQFRVLCWTLIHIYMHISYAEFSFSAHSWRRVSFQNNLWHQLLVTYILNKIAYVQMLRPYRRSVCENMADCLSARTRILVLTLIGWDFAGL